jgi:hypothetical protein
LGSRPVDSESVLDQDELPEFEGSETALVDRDSVPKIKP